MPSQKLDINSASLDELKEATFIGEKLAEAIYRYREDHGDFQSAKDLEKVPGISGQRVEGILQYFTVGESASGGRGGSSSSGGRGRDNDLALNEREERDARGDDRREGARGRDDDDRGGNRGGGSRGGNRR